MTKPPEIERPECALRMMRIASSIAAQLDLDPLLQEIVDTAAELGGAEFGGILVLDEQDPTRYEVLRIHGWPTPCGLAQPQGRGILGLPHKKGRPLRLAQIDQHPASVGLPAGHPPIGPFLGVPLRFRDRVLGSLFLGQRLGHPPFTPEDEALLTGLADLATVAIENARLYAKAEEVARLQERERLAPPWLSRTPVSTPRRRRWPACRSGSDWPTTCTTRWHNSFTASALRQSAGWRP
jgi:GAF domain-containing protein